MLCITKNWGEGRGLHIEVHSDMCMLARWRLHCNGGCHRLTYRG